MDNFHHQNYQIYCTYEIYTIIRLYYYIINNRRDSYNLKDILALKHVYMLLLVKQLPERPEKFNIHSNSMESEINFKNLYHYNTVWVLSSVLYKEKLFLIDTTLLTITI